MSWRKVGSWFLSLALLLLVMSIALQLLLPTAAARAVEEALYEGLGRPEKLAVKVEAFPAVEMLAGRIDGLEIRASGGGTSGFNWSRLEMSARNLRVDLPSLIAGRQINVVILGQAMASLSLTEQELFKWLTGQVGGGVQVTGLRLLDRLARFDCKVRLLGRTIDFSVTGSFSVEDHRLVFSPAKLEVEGEELGRPLASRILDLFDLTFPVPQLPAGLVLVEAEIMDSRLELTARNRPRP
ncbi:MAG: DUF2993 domain-containing protein [Bacillota bacterium]